MSRSAKISIAIVIIILLAAVGWYVWSPGTTDSPTPSPSPLQTINPGAQNNQQSAPQSFLKSSPTDVTDATLQADLAEVDAELARLDDDTKQVDRSITSSGL